MSGHEKSEWLRMWLFRRTLSSRAFCSCCWQCQRANDISFEKLEGKMGKTGIDGGMKQSSRDAGRVGCNQKAAWLEKLWMGRNHEGQPVGRTVDVTMANRERAQLRRKGLGEDTREDPSLALLSRMHAGLLAGSLLNGI